MPACRVDQSCMYTLYMTVYLVISLPILPYIHRIYTVSLVKIYIYIFMYVVLTNPTCV
jgi:hypothetical protein